MLIFIVVGIWMCLQCIYNFSIADSILLLLLTISLKSAAVILCYGQDSQKLVVHRERERSKSSGRERLVDLTHD